MRATSSILLTAATLLLGCSDSTGPSSSPSLRAPDDPGSSSFQVAPSTATLQYGQTLQFTITYSGDPALTRDPGSVIWRSDNAGVAAVSANGLVRGVSGGITRVVAVWGGSQASAVVTVVAPMKKHEDPAVCMIQAPRTGTPRIIDC